MEYFKVYKSGELIGAETAADPAFVRWQEKNDIIIRCPKEEAEAIVSEKDGETIFLLPGKQLHGVETDLSAVLVTQAEYEEALSIIGTLPDPEDEDPEIPEGQPDLEIMTRAELTEKVRAQADALQEQADTISMLQECLLEMSEAVYA